MADRLSEEEITQVLDRCKRPVVPAVMSWRQVTYKALTELLALRQENATLKAQITEARNTALEEAAQMIEQRLTEQYGIQLREHREVFDAIRALKRED